MTLPMRLRDTFAQRVLAYVAFCRLLSRTKKRSFLSSSPPFEPTILKRWKNSPLFPSKLINFFDCTPRPYTYFLLSKFYSSRIEMNSLEKKKRQEEFLPFLLRYVDFRGANLSKDSRICIPGLERRRWRRSTVPVITSGPGFIWRSAERILRAWSHYQTSLHRVKRFEQTTSCLLRGQCY